MKKKMIYPLFHHLRWRCFIDRMICKEKIILETKQYQTPLGQDGVETSIAFAPYFSFISVCFNDVSNYINCKYIMTDMYRLHENTIYIDLGFYVSVWYCIYWKRYIQTSLAYIIRNSFAMNIFFWWSFQNSSM